MGKRYLYLVRHGQYHMDKKHPEYGGLTSLGRKQARAVKKRLKEYPIARYHISTMKRARETASEITYGQLKRKNRYCNLLVEGIPEYPKVLVRKHKLKPVKMRQAKARMNKAFKKYFKLYKPQGEMHEAIICHGNIIRYLIAKSVGVETAKWVNFDIYQCSLTIVSIDDLGKIRLVTFGEVGHIPTPQRTFI